MAGFIKNILKTSLVMLIVPAIAFGVQQQNPRGTTSNTRNTARTVDTSGNASVRRSATSVIARSVNNNKRTNRTVVTARPSALRSASVRSVRPVINGNSVARTASKPSIVRSGIKQKIGGANVSRAGVSRATAVFNDISKIGGGYSNCRDAYATCMDQFCANANDTYRRCYCSDRFVDFRETADNLDEALKLLADFQDNNLNAVDKSAAEVNAMYTATAGEAAIKRDTSASQQLLDSISDVLSGKKKTENKQTLLSMGLLDFSGFNNNDDIFGDTSSLFGNKNEEDISSLEGKELFNSAAKQCIEITRETCSSDAIFNLAKSAYSIMITQDCNAYEKNINAKKASVEETVRTAEKYLREARLEEYRSHNSADVNECLTKVEEAIRQPTACGSNYEKCLDYTGQYINTLTGEPIYSQALFGLNKLITLDGKSADVLGQNTKFDKWLDEKKMFATKALDTCRDDAEIVWYEFKRSALIQIAQAQDEKIQEVKDSCVETVKQCYDKQTGDLLSMDTTELQGTGAIAATTARGMCYDRVQACAALYGDPDGCVYDDAKKKLSTKVGKCGDKDCKCGLQSLLTFVDTVDSVKVAEGCETVLKKYVAEICPAEYETDEKTGEKVEKLKYGGMCKGSKNELRAALNNRMKLFCAQDLVNSDKSNTLNETSAFNTNIMNQIIKNIYDELGIAFTAGCEEVDSDTTAKEDMLDEDGRGGIWVTAGEVARPAPDKLYQPFYKKYYGTYIKSTKQIDEFNLEDKGWCLAKEKDEVKTIVESLETGEVTEDTYGAMCEVSGGKWNNNQCEFGTKWYTDMCVDVLEGTWSSDVCIVDNITNEDK